MSEEERGSYAARSKCRWDGIVEMVGEEVVFKGGFKKRELVLVRDAQYPAYASFEFVKEKADAIAAFRKGEKVAVEFYPESRYWDPKDGRQGRWFTSCRGISATRAGSSAAVPQPASAPAASAEPAVDPDNLPF